MVLWISAIYGSYSEYRHYILNFATGIIVILMGRFISNFRLRLMQNKEISKQLKLETNSMMPFL
ncbi:hypothetical protein AU490_04885 [Lonsdalea populi]|uniref:Uncharacterized protein n=2 Tax=Lonsdalea TaxID=1082702 RepID=A0ACD1JGV5_9GAMM|nr:hypothetical protein AU508_06470 [Lonsdalea populi]RAT16666.1 hypothetical protein AU485_00135 [Lonsdalea quercina]OSN01813.1 hypothetical protein AU499_04205 [Lonsdalea populi]RAT16874.1 hypothetical protein AU486_06775 [Lonsdalea quercina]RAT20223.1 hypothetical protein AU488_14600 [Lonsdalea populi]